MITQIIRKIVSGKNDRYVFNKFDHLNDNMRFAKRMGLYTHVPFCRNKCPYCPYYKETYEVTKSGEYLKGLLQEIKYYGKIGQKPEWTSWYIGGGTPTLIIKDLFEIKEVIRTELGFNGPIALETTPNELSKENIEKLEQLGVQYLSVGVQSFQDKYLSVIGRDCRSRDIRESLGNLNGHRFSTVNVDLIFVFPGQEIVDVKKDLEAALEFSPEQITCYPLFTFPYSSIGEYMKLKHLSLPNAVKRRKFYYFIHDYLSKHGYQRTSVWSFNKPGTVPYSSVTRDYYLGLGPGAGSYTGDGFYFNTFSIDEYIRSLQIMKRLPIALKMPISQRMSKLSWLYWRLYETDISRNQYRKLFDARFEEDFGLISEFLKMFGFLENENADILRLNRRGSHWIHLFQNYFALNYVTKVWQACKQNPWPEFVAI
ncbi:MAG: radical SAM protein [Candidatus Omnitrophota bacterium]